MAAIPADVTDWVLVELRSGSDPASIVGQRAAFIKSDGSVVDLDGTSPVSFFGIPAGDYYIAVRHRNHLGIRSAGVQTVTDNMPLTYDFSTAN